MAKPKVKPQRQAKPQPAPKAAPATEPPSWPPIKQHLPLHAQPHPSAPDKILLVPNFLPPSLCRTYLSFVRGLPLATTPGKPKRGNAVRVNDRFQVDDGAFAGRLYEVLRGVLEDPQFAHLWWVAVPFYCTFCRSSMRVWMCLRTLPAVRAVRRARRWLTHPGAAR